MQSLIGLLTTGAVAGGEVAALDHEVLDDAMEPAAGVALALRLLRQLDEVVHGLRHGAAEQADDNATDRLVADRHVEVDLCAWVGGDDWLEQHSFSSMQNRFAINQ